MLRSEVDLQRLLTVKRCHATVTRELLLRSSAYSMVVLTHVLLLLLLLLLGVLWRSGVCGQNNRRLLVRSDYSGGGEKGVVRWNAMMVRRGSREERGLYVDGGDLVGDSFILNLELTLMTLGLCILLLLLLSAVVQLLVLLHCTLRGEPMAAVGTLEGSVVQVIPAVVLQNGLGRQHLAAYVALELGAISVFLHVHGVRVLGVEDFTAILALELLRSSVQLVKGVHVALKGILLREPQLTVFALVWFLSCVATHVELQGLALRKGLAADVAFEGAFSRVDVQVLLQGSLLREGLVAVLTLVHLLGFVETLMAHEVRRRVELLITFRALEAVQAVVAVGSLVVVVTTIVVAAPTRPSAHHCGHSTVDTATVTGRRPDAATVAATWGTV